MNCSFQHAQLSKIRGRISASYYNNINVNTFNEIEKKNVAVCLFVKTLHFGGRHRAGGIAIPAVDIHTASKELQKP